jgi:hypothetical protein
VAYLVWISYLRGIIWAHTGRVPENALSRERRDVQIYNDGPVQIRQAKLEAWIHHLGSSLIPVVKHHVNVLGRP